MAPQLGSVCSLAALLLLATLPASYGIPQLLFNPEQVKQAQAKVKGPPPQIFYDGVNPPDCPELDGIFADATFCDAYWTCTNGVAAESICEDGLVFAPSKAGHSDPCDTPHVVNCGTRQELQDPTFPSEFCPRRHGTFEHPDPTVCDVYYQCVSGVHTEMTCAVGLHFNGTQGSCNWPGIAQREGCVDKPKVSEDGAFSCPPGPHFNADGVENPHPAFPHATDCTKFYVCLNGVTPQDASCSGGQVFDEVSMMCALPARVPECDGWFADDPDYAHLYYDVAPAAKGRSDPGNVDVVSV